MLHNVSTISLFDPITNYKHNTCNWKWNVLTRIRHTHYFTKQLNSLVFNHILGLYNIMCYHKILKLLCFHRIYLFFFTEFINFFTKFIIFFTELINFFTECIHFFTELINFFTEFIYFSQKMLLSECLVYYYNVSILWFWVIINKHLGYFIMLVGPLQEVIGQSEARYCLKQK
jgi:hypothetical protein